MLKNLFLLHTMFVRKFEYNVVGSDGHTFVYSLHRYRYRYIVSNDRYKRTPSVICL
jgi:hypothetical protein